MNTIYRFFSIVLILFTISCDAFYIIPLDDKSETLHLNFECGQADIYLQNWQGVAFDFYQTFKVEKKVILNLDSLKIKFKGNYYPCNFPLYPDSIKLSIIGEKQIRTAFEINRTLNKGDTLFVFPRGYIYCNDKAIEIPNLTLVLNEDLRGPGF